MIYGSTFCTEIVAWSGCWVCTMERTKESTQTQLLAYDEMPKETIVWKRCAEVERHIKHYESDEMATDSNLHALEIDSAPIFNGAKIKPYFFCRMARNITDQKRIHRERIQSSKQAKLMSRAKSSSHANTRHKKRRPINGAFEFLSFDGKARVHYQAGKDRAERLAGSVSQIKARAPFGTRASGCAEAHQRALGQIRRQ